MASPATKPKRTSAEKSGSLRFFMSKKTILVGVIFGVIAMALTKTHRDSSSVSSKIVPAGGPKTMNTRMLEWTSRLLQSYAPLGGNYLYFTSFPVSRDEKKQMQAHHYCKQINEDFAQCVLFDSNSADAIITGCEYIISDRLFERLPASEKRHWHSHAEEVMSGRLACPGLPRMLETNVLKHKLNTHGKVWQFWMPSLPLPNMDDGGSLPFGDDHLAWSFVGERAPDPELMRQAGKEMGIDWEQKRQEAVRELSDYLRPEHADTKKPKKDPM